MGINRAKSIIKVATFALVLTFGIGMVSATTAQAQSRDRNNRWDRNDRDGDRRRDGDRDRGDWNRRQQVERARAIERARQLQWERERARRTYNYPRTYPRNGGGNYGYGGGNYGYGGGNYGYGGGYNNGEVQKGYRDGLDRGQEDARDRRSPNPNNSSHFRSGNSAYREGFARGYQVGYRQYAGSRRW
jgi:hypothetical protein